MTTNCTHNEVEFHEGNYLPPYGWEQAPGWYCADCGENVTNTILLTETD